MDIGFTTSFPVEIVFAAGHKPVDLNNLFITKEPLKHVQAAESEGFPRNICSWIKGMYYTIMEYDFKTVISVIQGDCSNNHSMMSILQDKGIDVIPFSFPAIRDRQALAREISQLRERFSVSEKQVLEVKRELDLIRKKLLKLDRLTWQERKISGAENHYWLINSSDFQGNPVEYNKKLDDFLSEVDDRPSSFIAEKSRREIRLAFIGVPPIFIDLYEFLAEQSADVIFNEVQRQFAMPYLRKDLIDQYLVFTYPYSAFERLEDITEEVSKRNIDGIISYSQAFCHLQIDNILFKKYLRLPFLTIEGDQPAKLDERTKLRLESFLDVIRFNEPLPKA